MFIKLYWSVSSLKSPCLAVLLTLLLSGGVWAQEEGAEAEAAEGEPAVVKTKAIYIPLKPPFVVNYGGKGRLKYMKAELSVRVSDMSGANSIRHHMPYIRNDLILLFSRQNDENLDTMEGKELLRQEALQTISAILEAENGESSLVDLYFNQLVIQK